MEYSGTATAKIRPASAARSLSRRGNVLCFGTVAAITVELLIIKNVGRICRYKEELK